MLQNSVWISQLLKRKKVTLLVHIMGGYPEWLQNMTETITLQITTALQQVLTAADLLYLRQNLGEIHSCYSCVPAFAASQNKNTDQG